MNPSTDGGDWNSIVATLSEKGIEFEPGLTNAEVDKVQSQFAFLFPPDLREFLQTALPVGDRFPDWRRGTVGSLKHRLAWPLDGILFDIEHNSFWMESWGVRPAELGEAKSIAERYVALGPRLIPIYAHRMMPDRPHDRGNPVFSVWQTDIIYYGIDLRDYLAREFCEPSKPFSDLGRIREIEFWSQLAG